MREIKFNRIVLEGFRSYRNPVPFDLNPGGLTLIKGMNGAGKTTIFSALCWCLFKINLNETKNEAVQTWAWLRGKEYRGTRVIIDFSVGDDYYRIARHLNFKGTTCGIAGKSSLMIFKNGDHEFTDADLVGEAQHKGDQQVYLNDLFGMDSHTFLNSILFGQRMSRFINAPNDEKRELLESLFDLDFIEFAKEVAKEKKDEYAKDLLELEKTADAAKNAGILYADQLRRDEGLINKFNEDRKARVVSLKTKIKSKESEVHTFNLDKDSKLLSLESAEAAEDNSELENSIKKAQDFQENLEGQLKTLKLDGEELEKQTVKVQEKIGEEVEKVSGEFEKADTQHRQEKTRYDRLNLEMQECKRKEAKYEVDLAEVKDNCPYCGEKLNAAKVKAVKEELRKNIQAERDAYNILDKGLKSLKLAESENKKDELWKTLIDIKLKLKVDPFKADKGKHEEKVTELKKKISDAESKVRNAKQFLKEVEAEQGKANEYKTQIEVLNEKISAGKKDIENFEKEIERENNTQPPQVDLDKTKKLIGQAEENKIKAEKGYAEKNSYLEKINWWINKGFGSGGLKAFVFSAMLNKLNDLVKRYASRLGFRVKFSVDLEKASKPFVTSCFKGDKEIDYADLSGGQKQRIDVCLAFAMHDLVGIKSNMNFLIMDEIFEGLDDEGVETAFDLIRMKAANRSVFVITHSTILDSMNAKTIYVDTDESGSSYLK